MHKLEKELSDIVRANGLKLVLATSLSYSTYRMHVEAQNGQQAAFVFHGSRVPREINALKRFAAANRITAVGSALREATTGKAAGSGISAQALEGLREFSAQADTNANKNVFQLPHQAATKEGEMEEKREKRTLEARLTQPQFYKLCEYVREAAPQTKAKTLVEFAHEAAQALGFLVATTSLQSALETTGAQWQPAARTLAAGKDRVRIVARCVVELFQELGKDVPPELRAIVSSTPYEERPE